MYILRYLYKQQPIFEYRHDLDDILPCVSPVPVALPNTCPTFGMVYLDSPLKPTRPDWPPHTTPYISSILPCICPKCKQPVDVVHNTLDVRPSFAVPKLETIYQHVVQHSPLSLPFPINRAIADAFPKHRTNSPSIVYIRLMLNYKYNMIVMMMM